MSKKKSKSMALVSPKTYKKRKEKEIVYQYPSGYEIKCPLVMDIYTEDNCCYLILKGKFMGRVSL